MKANKTYMNQLLQQLADTTGAATDKAEAINEGQTQYLVLDKNPMHEMYALCFESVENHSHTNAYNISSSEHFTIPEMCGLLRGFILGHEAGRNS